MTMQTLPGMEAAERPTKRNKVPERVIDKVHFVSRTTAFSREETRTLLISGGITQTLLNALPERYTKKSPVMRILAILEKRGMHNGILASDAAATLKLSEGWVREKMVEAGLLVTQFFGFSIGFFGADGRWRLGYGDDPVRKANTRAKDIATRIRNSRSLISSVKDQLEPAARRAILAAVPTLFSGTAPKALPKAKDGGQK